MGNLLSGVGYGLVLWISWTEILKVGDCVLAWEVGCGWLLERVLKSGLFGMILRTEFGVAKFFLFVDAIARFSGVDVFLRFAINLVDNDHGVWRWQ